MYDDIHQRGIDMLTRLDSASERHQLQMRLLDVEKRWRNLKAQIDERQKNLGRLVPNVAGYMEVHEQVVTWLNESETKFDELLSELSDVSDITVMAEKQAQLKVGTEWSSLWTLGKNKGIKLSSIGNFRQTMKQ